MELVDIIIFSLKLFSILVISILTISYIVFKLKDRKRIKPYMKSSSFDSEELKNVNIKDPIQENNSIKILNGNINNMLKINHTAQPQVVYEKPKVINYLPDNRYDFYGRGYRKE